MTPVIAPGGWKAQGTRTCAHTHALAIAIAGRYQATMMSYLEKRQLSGAPGNGPKSGQDQKISLSQNLDSGVADSHPESAGHQVYVAEA